MSKSEFVLQGLIIFLVSSIIALVVARMYTVPKVLVKATKEVRANENPIIISPITENFVPVLYQKTPPNQLSIPSLDLLLKIAEGRIVNDEWTLYDDRVSWLSTSEEPGRGNVILYAHNRKLLFGDLGKTAIGDFLQIDHRGNTYKYEIIDKRKVAPNEVEAILSSEDRLTLYTCDGAFDQKRLIVIAKRVE
ncbi:sortase [Candidatus Gottesmanbacteria bacterium]|nr:sortase [Candidatus Gottesmanbacteria bacterium]